MSNFTSLALIDGTLNGTAPCRFLGSSPDSLATILAAGYMNDLNKKIKQNDIVEINYADTSTFPLNTGEAALFGSFKVQYDPVAGNWNLVPSVNNQTGIAAYGVYSATANYAGGSTTLTINDSAITPNSVVIGRWQSSVTASIIKTILPGNGTITVVTSADPGVSVFSYIAILPNVALQNLGVIASKYSNAGGSATITISNPLITAGMEVNVNFASQANASEVKTAICSAGAITIVTTADPGVSVVEYVAALPSSALTTLGFYGATYTNAGGSATTTITDATITATSIVVADWASQANAAEIEKVTPSAGTLTILSSADPGASVLNYSATPRAEGTNENVYLPIAGGQMTGQLLVDRGTATSTAGAATINKQAGVITTEALTTAAASAYAFTLTNSRITTSSIVILMLMGGTNTTRGLELRAIPGAGSATISIFNNNVAASALNGTLIFGFLVI